jgi:hypothetical protein
MGQSKICFDKSCFVRLGQLRSQEISSEESAAMRSGHEGGSISWAAIGQIHIAIGQIHILPIALRLDIRGMCNSCDSIFCSRLEGKSSLSRKILYPEGSIGHGYLSHLF